MSLLYVVNAVFVILQSAGERQWQTRGYSCKSSLHSRRCSAIPVGKTPVVHSLL